MEEEKKSVNCCASVTRFKDDEIEVSETVKSECTQQFRDWLESNERPFRARTDDDFIRKFLYGCKFNLSKTEKKLTRYYELRKKHPVWFTNRNIEDEALARYVDRGFMMANIEQPDHLGRIVCTIDFSRLIPGDDVYKLLRLALITVESALLDVHVQNYGIVAVANCCNIPKEVLHQCTPKFLYNFVKCVLLGLPVRMKGMHFINVSPAVIAVIKLFKICLTEKLRKRVFVYGKDFQTLFDNVPHKCMPNEFGGTGGEFKTTFNTSLQLLKESTEYLLADEIYGFPIKNAVHDV